MILKCCWRCQQMEKKKWQERKMCVKLLHEVCLSLRDFEDDWGGAKVRDETSETSCCIFGFSHLLRTDFGILASISWIVHAHSHSFMYIFLHGWILISNIPKSGKTDLLHFPFRASFLWSVRFEAGWSGGRENIAGSRAGPGWNVGIKNREETQENSPPWPEKGKADGNSCGKFMSPKWPFVLMSEVSFQGELPLIW